jgi:hypothetical protein
MAGSPIKVLVNVELEGLETYSSYPLTYSNIVKSTNSSVTNQSVSELGGIYVTNDKNYPVVIIYVPDHMIGSNNDGYQPILAIVIKKDPSVNNGYYVHNQVYCGNDDGGFYYSFQEDDREKLQSMQYRLATNLKVHFTNFTPRFEKPNRA